MLTSRAVKVAKVLICGMKGVGKTALLEQLVNGNIIPQSEFCSTIEDIYVASVDTGRGTREILRIYDSAGLQGKAQLPRHYLCFPDGYILVYDPSDTSSLDILADIKADIDKNKEKKEVCIIVLANMRSKATAKKLDSLVSSSVVINQPDPVEAVLSRASNWCARERIKHYAVNAMERASLYEAFINLTIRLYPPQIKSTFPQLRQVIHKSQKNENS